MYLFLCRWNNSDIDDFAYTGKCKTDIDQILFVPILPSPSMVHQGIPSTHLHVIGFHARLCNASKACPEDRAQKAPQCLERDHSQQCCKRCNWLWFETGGARWGYSAAALA